MAESNEELLLRLKKHAESKGIKLNDNKTILNTIVNGLMRNKELYGEYYCPCRNIEACRKAGKDLICPCINHLKGVREDGHCHCWLFIN